MAEKSLTGNGIQPSAAAGGCPPVMSWFVMRVTYSRELKAQALLQSVGVECFVPMRTDRSGAEENQVPAVHNFIFVHTTRDFMDMYKRKVEELCPMRYMMDRSTRLPMVVRDKEMDDFMRVTANEASDIIYLDNPEAALNGALVEILSGPFIGVQGRVLRVRKDRKVALQLAGVVAVAVSGIPISDLKIIENLQGL